MTRRDYEEYDYILAAEQYNIRNILRITGGDPDHKISRRRVEKLAAETQYAAKEIFERLNPGFWLVEQPEIKVSDYVPGAYIYARMRRKE